MDVKKQSSWVKWGAVFLSILVYVLLFNPLSQLGGESVGALSLIPVAVAAWMFGVPGGLIVGVLLIVFNFYVMEIYAAFSLSNRETVTFILGSVILILTGVFVGIICTMHNRSEEKLRAHRQILSTLEDLTRRYQGIFESSMIAIALVDDHYRIEDVNPAASDLVGYSWDELYHKKLHDLVVTDHRDLLEAKFEEFSQSGRATGEVSLARKDNQPMLVEYMWISGDKGGMHMIMARDITERKQRENELIESEKRFAKIFQLSPASVSISTVDTGAYLDVNEGFTHLIGYSPEEVIGKTALELNIWVDREDRQKMLDMLQTTHSARNLSIRYRKKNGEIVDELVSWELIDYKSQPAILAVAQDITEQKLVEKLVRMQKEIMDAILAASPVGIALVRNNCMEWTNERLEQMLGYSISSLESQNIRMLFTSKKEYERVANALFADAERFTVGQIDTHWVRQDGSLLDVHLQSRFIDQDDPEKGQIIAAIDITERKRIEASLRYLSTHDSLTGLYNRTYYEEELSRLAKSRQFPLGFVICDVDGLKATNDLSGHFAGDKLLISVAQILRTAFRDGDIIARLGGDEFGVLLPNTGEDSTNQILDRIQTELERRAGSSQKSVRMSIGFAAAYSPIEIGTARRKADQRMYENKVARRQKN